MPLNGHFILDIQNSCFSDIRNNIVRYTEKNEYFGYQQKCFPISEIIISDIKNVFGISRKNKAALWIFKILFQISEIVS